MDFLFDLHTHTIACGHAYSTLKENMDGAKEAGLLVYGLSEHAEGVPGSCNNMFFKNLKVLPRNYRGMTILRGIEADILDYEGNLDADEDILKRLDYAIASLHVVCIQPGTLDQNMRAYFGAMKNPYITILGHPDDGRYPIDRRALAKEAKKQNVVLELNNSSLNPAASRTNGLENAKELLRCCEREGTSIICNTDSHYADDVGRFARCQALLEEMHFPPELVLNNDLVKLKKVLYGEAARMF